MPSSLDYLRSALRLVQQGPKNLQGMIAGSPEEQTQYQNWQNTQIRKMGLDPSGMSEVLSGDPGGAPSLAVIPKIFGKLPNKDLLKAIKLNELPFEEMLPKIPIKDPLFGSFSSASHRKGFFDADTNTFYGLKEEDIRKHHQEIAELLGFEKPTLKNALKNNLIRYYMTPREINLEAVGNEKTIPLLKSLLTEKLPISSSYGLDIHSPNNIMPLDPGTLGSSWGSLEDLKRLLSNLTRK